jgi:CII-binding regulator of phage lambda lysogenization HflD
MALYRKLFNKVLELAYTGRLMYKVINQIAILDQVIQQGSNNTKSTTFRSALIELYNDTISELT